MTDNKSILEKANAAVSAGDNEGFLAFCTDDTIWHFIGDQILIGKEAVRNYMKKVYVQPPEFDVETLISEGNFVTVIGKISLLENGIWKKYDYCDVWQIRDGKLHELRAFVVKIR